jgi:hypothetical protein
MTSGETITLDLSDYSGAQPTYVINDTINVSGLTDTITIGNIDSSTFNWTFTTAPFENGFPDWDDFQSMCKEYPGLQITFEKMKEFYNLCRSDWEGKKRGEK